MLTEIVKFVPKMSAAELSTMFNNLSTRFGNVAKKFGKGLKDVIMGGGIFGVAAGLLNKLLNPLQEIQASIDKTLERADSLSTDAKEFGTTEGKLFKLQTLGKSFGLEEQTLNVMLTKFQTALAEARKPGAEPSAVSAFTDETDLADAFFKFAQSMKDAPKDTQVLAQQEVFGERLMGKAREFFQQDLDAQLVKLGAKSSESYTPGIQRAGDVADLNELLTAQREMEDFLKKSSAMTESMVLSKDKSERQAMDQEQKRLESYDDLKRASTAIDGIQMKLETGFTFLYKQIPAAITVLESVGGYINLAQEKIGQVASYLSTIANSAFVRGVTSGLKGLFK